MKQVSDRIDRLAQRARPEGDPIMEQTWQDLLFLHWQVDPALIRPLIPAPLQIDMFEKHTYVGITPFTIPNLRAHGLPPIPGASSFHEINLRTYVHYRGVPGVWFFSLDASKILPALAARLFYSLPYFKAEIQFQKNESGTFHFTSQRLDATAAEFEATWLEGIELRSPDTESLAFFLTERYCLYSADSQHLYRSRIYHAPWNLRDAELINIRSSLFSAQGLPEPSTLPLLHFAREQNVEVWPSERII
ncbi:MAG: YqjF family protein [Limisphaerales bacterium]